MWQQAWEPKGRLWTARGSPLVSPQCRTPSTRLGGEAPVWGLLQAKGSDFGWSCARIGAGFQRAHRILRQIWSPGPLLPLPRGRQSCVHPMWGWGSVCFISPLTSNWESTPLVPVCLLEKPTLTSDLQAENPSWGGWCGHCSSFPGSWYKLPKGPGFPDLRLHLGHLGPWSALAPAPSANSSDRPQLEEKKGCELRAKNPQSGHMHSTKTALLDSGSPMCPQQGGGHQPHHFCLDDFCFLPFHLIFSANAERLGSR